MVRAIDLDALKKYIKKTDLTAVERGALLQAISNMPTLTPPNEPLTWNELGNMVEKPVYIVELEDGESCWVLVHTVDDIKALFVSAFDQYDYGNRELYGQTWLAYRRPPEGDRRIKLQHILPKMRQTRSSDRAWGTGI